MQLNIFRLLLSLVLLPQLFLLSDPVCAKVRDGIQLFNDGEYAAAEAPLKALAGDGNRVAQFLYCRVLPQISEYTTVEPFERPKECPRLAYSDEFEGEYFVGDKLTKDKQQAYNWFSSSKQSNNAYAMWMLASFEHPFLSEGSLMSGLSEGIAAVDRLGGNHAKFTRIEDLYSRVATLLELPARKGFQSANGQLGLLLMYGAGVPTNLEKARNHFELAGLELQARKIKQLDSNFSVVENNIIDQGEKEPDLLAGPPAAGILSRAAEDRLSNGDKNSAKLYFGRAEAIYRKLSAASEPLLAAHFIYLLAKLHFSQLGLEDFHGKEWERNLSKAAEMKDRDALYELSVFQQFTDEKTASSMLFDAAELGHAEAQFRVANRFLAKGQPTQSYSWHLRAARQGFGKSQIAAGIMNLHGIGVAQNFEDAYFWFSLASANAALDETYCEDGPMRCDRAFARQARDVAAQKLPEPVVWTLQSRTKDFKPELDSKFD